MSRRPKLSLVSSRKLDKQQALGREGGRVGSGPEAADPGGGRSEEAADHDAVARPYVKPEQLHARSSRTESGWPSVGSLAKAAFLLGTVALSIYLIKRRLL